MNGSDSAAVLASKHFLAGYEVTVKPSFMNCSWHQREYAETEESSGLPCELMQLNDDCIRHIFNMLNWLDLIDVDQTCLRFQRIAEGTWRVNS